MLMAPVAGSRIVASTKAPWSGLSSWQPPSTHGVARPLAVSGRSGTVRVQLFWAGGFWSAAVVVGASPAAALVVAVAPPPSAALVVAVSSSSAALVVAVSSSSAALVVAVAPALASVVG